MRIISNLCTILALVCLSAQNSSGQCPITYIYDGEAAENWFGQSLASAGDVNNDGFDDLIIGAMYHTSNIFREGRVYVFSGMTGDTLYVFSGDMAEIIFGRSVASAGDVNNDGFDDFIIGAPQTFTLNTDPGRAYVFSGKTGDTLYAFTGETNGDRFGYTVASAGDVNNDSFDDFIIGAIDYNSGRGRAYVFSGQTGDTLYIFDSEGNSDEFGIISAAAGDINNDGYDDIIVSAWINNSDSGRGYAYVFSGQTGDTLYVFRGEAASDFFGVSAASAGDVNNDGYDDIIIGAHFNDAGGIDAGRAYVFSGQTGDTLHIFTGAAAGDFFGLLALPAGDMNGDGYDDLIIGAQLNDGAGADFGRAYVFSGRTGDTLLIFDGEESGALFGGRARSAGDVNNDGRPDLIIGAFLSDSGGVNAGRVYVYSGCDLSCCVGDRGDLNDDGDNANILDLTFAVDRIFRGGSASACPEEADVNADGTPHNILDLTFLVDRIFRGGPAPGPC